MIFSAVYLLVRCLLSCLMALTQRDVSKDAELLALRHENAVSRRQASRSGGSRATGCGSQRCPG